MATEIKITLPEKLFLKAQQIAKSKQADVHDVIVDAISFDFDEETSEEEVDPQQKEWDEVYAYEEKAFAQVLPELLQSHKGQYVAVKNQQLIDSDTDLGELHSRVRKIYPDEFVLMTQVIEDYPRVLRVTSFRLV